MERLGRYTILRELGKGSRGHVYVARDPVIERDVVLKTLRTELARNEEEQKELLERFRREARALGQLKHPAIVTIYDVARDEGSGLPYLAMEYIPGADLQSVTRAGMALPVSQVADIGAQVARTLAFAHANGIVHRDIKPSNLILGVDGVVRIADFGIAKIQGSDITQIGLTLGTPSYMAPEQVRGAAVDGRTDIFALGVVLYELLTGEKPFGAGPAEEIARRVLKDHPVAPMARRARVPRDLSSFVMRCLEKEPADRWQEADELAASLSAVAVRERGEGDEAETAVRLSVAAVRADPGNAPEPSADEFLDAPRPAVPADPEPEGVPVDTEAIVADTELLRGDPIVIEGRDRKVSPWLSALLLLVGLVGFVVVVVTGGRGLHGGGWRGIFDEPVTWIHTVSSRDLDAAPTAAPTAKAPATRTPAARRPEWVEARLQVARRELRDGHVDNAVGILQSLEPIVPGDAEIRDLLREARSASGR